MRLPGKCAGCEKPMELATDRVTRKHRYTFDTASLPMAWCDLGTDTAHACGKSSGTMSA